MFAVFQMIQCWHGDTGSGLGNALWEGCVLLSHMLSLFALETEGEPTCAVSDVAEDRLSPLRDPFAKWCTSFQIKGKRCIELGCGPGLLAVTCAKLGESIVSLNSRVSRVAIEEVSSVVF